MQGRGIGHAYLNMNYNYGGIQSYGRVNVMREEVGRM
jgi:hypothetical protein